MPVTVSFDADGQQQKLFGPRSLASQDQELPIKLQNDFSFHLRQLTPLSSVLVSTVKTKNLTTSVEQLIEKSGCTSDEIDTLVLVRLSPSMACPRSPVVASAAKSSLNLRARARARARAEVASSMA